MGDSILGLLVTISADPSKAQEAITQFEQATGTSFERASGAPKALDTALLSNRESVRLLSEEMGVHLPRAVSGAVAEMIPAISAVGPVLLGAFAVEEMPKLVGSISAAMQSWAGFGEAERKAMDAAIKDTEKLYGQVLSVEHELELMGKTQAAQAALRAKWAADEAEDALKPALAAEEKQRNIEKEIATQKTLYDINNTKAVILLNLEDKLKVAQTEAAKAREAWTLKDLEAFKAQKQAAEAALAAQVKIAKATPQGPDYFSRIFGTAQQLGTYAVAIDGVTKAIDVDVKSINLWANELKYPIQELPILKNDFAALIPFMTEATARTSALAAAKRMLTTATEGMLGTLNQELEANRKISAAMRAALAQELEALGSYLAKKADMKALEQVAEAISCLAAQDYVGGAEHLAAAAAWGALGAAVSYAGGAVGRSLGGGASGRWWR
jgi:hypothetical protein